MKHSEPRPDALAVEATAIYWTRICIRAASGAAVLQLERRTETLEIGALRETFAAMAQFDVPPGGSLNAVTRKGAWFPPPADPQQSLPLL